MAVKAGSRKPGAASGRQAKRPAGAKKPEKPGGADHVVALGASAGGFKALGRLLGGLPADFPAPILAVLHIAPEHMSHLAALLQRETRLSVYVAKQGQVLEAGSVYVAPPDRHLEVQGRKVSLSRGARVQYSRPSIDRLFSSVAETYRDQAVAVVLSGTGSDGTAGVESIKAEGGFVVAQDPEDAEFGAMPAHAVATGCVDAVLPIDAIPAALVRAVGPPPLEKTPPEWPRVLSLLEESMGTDFTGYRETTLRRRLQRRIIATQQPDLSSYLSRLRKDPDELQRLHAEFLIKVSGFFRDPQEWTQLAAKIVGPLVRGRGAPREFRVWSAGCATGEEAYSLAILFREALEASGTSGQIKVFATDIDDEALAIARRGTYTEAQVDGLSQARRRRHFRRAENGWRVGKDLRKMVIFGRHDLLRDPPLASIDVLACRNVLIYFQPDQAKAVLQRLVYALKPGGHLFLGRSEGLHKAGTGLTKVSGSTRIFQRIPADDPPRRLAPLPPRHPPDLREPANAGRRAMPAPAISAMETLAREAPHVVFFRVDASGLITVWNEAAAGFFDVRPPDALGMRVVDIVGKSFWEPLERSMREGDGGTEATGHARVAYGPAGGQGTWLDVGWVRVDGGEPDGQGLMFLAVEAPDRPPGDGGEDGSPDERTARQGIAAEEALQSANQELETLNEELQNTSEEQQTLNEELESRNEELATVNEELQSLNEELNTLNEEVGVRILESEKWSGFLRTILDLEPQPVIGCDDQNTITFWNNVARKQFHLSQEQAVGKDLFDLVPVLDVPKVRKLVRGRRRGSTKIDKGPGGGPLLVDMAPVRDGGGRRRGYCLRISDDDDGPRAKK